MGNNIIVYITQTRRNLLAITFNKQNRHYGVENGNKYMIRNVCFFLKKAHTQQTHIHSFSRGKVEKEFISAFNFTIIAMPCHFSLHYRHIFFFALDRFLFFFGELTEKLNFLSINGIHACRSTEWIYYF